MVKKKRPAENKDPEILILGPDEMVKNTKLLLKDIRAVLRQESYDSSADELIQDHTLALILAGPLPKVRIPTAVRKLRQSDSGRSLPVFAIVPSGMQDREVRQIYIQGAAAVFEWPKEKGIIANCLVEMIAVDQVRGRASKPDSALARRVRSQLKIMNIAHHDLHVDVRKGIVTISGTIDVLWKTKEIEDAVSNIPGVRSINSRGLNVAPTRITDRTLKQKILRLMRDASDIDESTLSIAVSNGFITLAGSISDQKELRRLLSLITHIYGVRGIDRLMVVSSPQKRKDRTIANRLARSIRNLFPHADVDVSFFGGSAILSGNVQTLATKKTMENVTYQDGEVQRVVNKIQVQ